MSGSDIDEPPLETRTGAGISSDKREEEQAKNKKDDVAHERDLLSESCSRKMGAFDVRALLGISKEPDGSA